MLDCVSWGTEGQGVLMRQHGFLHTGSQSKDTILGHVTHMQVLRKVMREHHNGGNGHYKALVLAVTKWMLYGEETPLVGVGLVYKPHYISTEPFCTAYMHLHVWHAAGSSVESEDKLNSSCLIFVNVSEMSDMIPVATQHPVLLDVATKETTMRTGKPMAPLSFRGFRLHTVWTRQSGADLVHQITFPRFLGETTTSMLEYKPEKFPQGLMQEPKMVINLRPPSGNHWNITTDLVLPLAVDTFRWRHEAKCAAQGLRGESEGAKVSPKEAPVPRESPQVVVGSSRAALPTETTHLGGESLGYCTQNSGTHSCHPSPDHA